MCICVCVSPVTYDSLQPDGLWPARLLLSMKFSWQEYWNGLPFPSPGDLPDAGIESGSLALQTDSFHLSHQGSPIHTYTYTHTYIYKAIYILRLFSLIDYYKILHTVPCFIQYIGCLFVTGQSWARAGHLREQSHLSLSILETKLTPSFCVILTSKEKCFELKSNRRNHPSTQSVSLILSCWRLQIPD